VVLCVLVAVPVRFLLVVLVRAAGCVVRSSLVRFLRMAVLDVLGFVAGYCRGLVLDGRRVPVGWVFRLSFRVLDVRRGAMSRGRRRVSRANDHGVARPSRRRFRVMSRRVLFRDGLWLRLRVNAPAGRRGRSCDRQDRGVTRTQQDRRQDDRRNECSRQRDRDAG
jgi:hypothetical protein